MEEDKRWERGRGPNDFNLWVIWWVGGPAFLS